MNEDNSQNESKTSVDLPADYLKRLEKKAEMSRAAYLECTIRLQKKTGVMIIASIIFTILLSYLSLWLAFIADFTLITEQILALIASGLAIGVLVFSLSDRLFGWDQKRVEFKIGFNAWTGYIRQSQEFRKVELPTLDTNVAKEMCKHFEDKYSSLATTLPPNTLSDEDFLLCKQKFLRKIEISRKLEKDPSLNVKKEWRAK